MERLTDPQNRYLIFGASGLVGKEIASRLPISETRAYAYSNTSKNLITFDVTRTDRLREEIISRRPEAVFWAVNMAGGVNGCETNPSLARTIHLETTKALVDACTVTGATLIFLSSDYVFSDSSVPVTETDPTTPLNLYGKLKRESEQLITSQLKKYIIARTTNVYGWDPDSKTPNFYMQVYRTLKKGESLVAPSCLHGNPTLVSDLVDGIFSLLKANAFGIFHIVGPENVTRHAWAKAIAAEIGADPSLILDATNFKNEPKRPLTIELSTRKIREKVTYQPKTVKEGLDALRELRKG